MTTPTHTPKIAALPRRNIGEDNEVITEIHVAITTTDGINELTLQAFSYAIPEDELTGPYTPVDELTTETILGWVPAETMTEWEAAMEAQLATKVARDAAAARSDVPDHLI
jgi:hypothetical protein